MLSHRKASLAFSAFAFLMLCASRPMNAQTAHLVLHSEPGDFIGGGNDFDITFTPANTVPGWFNASILSVLNIAGLPAYLSFDFLQPNQGDFATLDFATNRLGIPIAPGTYTDAQRAPLAEPGHPGLNVTFQHRGSNTLTGSFTVSDLSFYTDVTNTLQINTFAVSFEQHSEGADPALFGTFTYDAGRVQPVPEPGSVALLIGMGLSGVSFVACRRRR